jgi:cyclase
VSLDVLAPGVLVWLQPSPRFGCPNAGVVVDEDGLTVVDTLMVRSQWEPFGQAVDELGRRVRRVVLTSSHIEFCGGTSRFRMAAVYGTRQISAHLDQPANLDGYRRLLPEFADEFEDDLATRPVTHVVTEPALLTAAVVAVPTTGQMAENLVVHVPGADVVFAGAMCSFGVTPLAFQGDPAAWADALDRLVDLAPIVVPGHGRLGGEEEVRDLQAYLRACVAAAGDPTRLGHGPWDGWSHREHDVVNVERAAQVAAGEADEVPPSMLRLAGLA